MTPIHDNLNVVRRHLVLGRFDTALRLLQPHLQRTPPAPEAWLRAGQALHGLGDFAAAEGAFRRLVQLRPMDPEAHLELGKTLESSGRRHAPEASYLRAIELDPRNPDAHVALGFRHLRSGDLGGAGQRFGAALRLASDHVGARAGAASVLERRGDLDDAWALVEPGMRGRAADLRIVRVAATVALRRGRPEDALPAVQRALKRRDLSTLDRAHLLHALGDLHDALDHVDRAFAAWRKANAARGLSFDPDTHDRTVAYLCDCMPAEAFAQPASAVTSDRPVLVVGVPRSGTSLVEQILASHPDVAAGGELHALRDAAASIPRRLGVEGAYLPHFASLGPDLLTELGQGYLEVLRGVDAGAKRVTDKMPHNVFHLGLAARIVPGARVVHCVRDPVDTLFSCFRQPFGAGLAYAADLTHLGRWYRAYRALMDHWEQVLPGAIHTVRYEELVARPEEQVRRLLDFVDLPWDPSVLQFHRMASTSTASYAQVQQPIYGSSVGRAQRYRAHLQPLLTAMEPPLVPA